MKKVYISPEIKVVTFTARHNILESSYIGFGNGVIESRRSSSDFWDSEYDDEKDE